MASSIIRMMNTDSEKFEKLRRKHERMRIYGRVLSRLNKIAGYILAILLCLYVYSLSFPETIVLETKRKSLLEIEKAKEISKNDYDAIVRANKALHEEPEYLELIARDALDYYTPGEIIFDVSREDRDSGPEKKQ